MRLRDLLIASCLLTTAFAQSNVHASLIPIARRKPAPAFHLTSAKGAVQNISNYRGNVVLLNFWASDCGGCVLEIPSLIRIEKAFRGQPFTAVGISMDISYDNLPGPAQAWNRVRPFAQSHHMDYPILMANEAMPLAYHITELPDTVLVDKQGRIAAVYVGIVNPEDVEANVRRLLAESPR